MMSSLTNQRFSGMRRRPSGSCAKRPSASISAAFVASSPSAGIPFAVRNPSIIISSRSSSSLNSSLRAEQSGAWFEFERSEGAFRRRDEVSARLSEKVEATESPPGTKVEGDAPSIGGSAKRWGFESVSVQSFQDRVRSWNECAPGPRPT